MAQVRGSVALDVVKALRHYKAWDDLPSALREPFGERVSINAWYDAEAYLALVRRLGEILERRRLEVPVIGRNGDVYEYMGSFWSGHYFDGTPFHAKGTSPERALQNFYNFWKLRHDTGNPKLQLAAQGQAEIELPDSGIVAREMCAIIRGALVGILKGSGAEGVEVAESECRARGDDRCLWRARWAPSRSRQPLAAVAPA